MDANSISTQIEAGMDAANTVMQAAKCRFFVGIGDLGEGALDVECFTTQALALSTATRMTVDVLARVQPDAEALLGEPAQLRISGAGGGEDSTIPLLVEGLEELDPSPEGARWRLHLASPLYPLTLNRHNRVFLNRTLAEIIEQVMTEAGFSADSLVTEFSAPQPPRDMVVQYEESDLDFLGRLLARDGAFYTVMHTDQGTRFLFQDDSNAMQETLGAVRLEFHQESGQAAGSEKVFAVSRTLHWGTARVCLEDQNPDTPDRMPRGEAIGPNGDGAHHLWGAHAVDSDQCQALARIRAEALDVARQTVVARADTAQLLPGMQLQLVGHPRYSGAWLVVAADIQGDQRVGHAFGQNSDRPGLLSALTLLPLELPYRSNAPWQRPPVHGTFSAVIEGDGGDYAYLDDQGRYRLRMPFDLSDAAQAEASPPVRLMQPYGGPDSGMHLPLHAGTEVLLSCVNGDIDRPVILGALSNPETPGPVTGANPSQHILRTRGGNELLMEDLAGEERIELFTRDRLNRLSLDARADGHQVTLETTDGDLHLVAGGHMNTEVTGSQTEQVGESKRVTVTESMEFQTREGAIEMTAATDMIWHASEEIAVSAETGSAALRAGKDLLLESGEDFSLEAVNGDVSINSRNGDLDISVNGSISMRGAGNKAIRIGQSGGMIEITPGGDLIIQGKNVEISGDSIKVNGDLVGGN
ncbi:MAG: type VI secretion system tip protein VgrG [Alcanivorax sp.]|nr:type VI secretion system tip protein VgrG [Alcanivorax sp.]